MVGLGGDGGVNLLLSGDSLLPPLAVQLPSILGPTPPSASRGISHSSQDSFSAALRRVPQRLQPGLVVLPDDVYLGVVGDVPQGDVGYPLIHEPVSNVPVCGHIRGRFS